MKKNSFKRVLSVLLVFSILLSVSAFFAYSAEEQTGYITNDLIRVRTSPTTKLGDANRLIYNGEYVFVNTGDYVTVLETVNSTNGDTANPKWCHIKFKLNGATLEGYITAQYVKIIDDTEVQMPDGVPEIYKEYIENLLKIHPNWNFVFYDTGYDWDELFTTSAQGYVGRSLISYVYPLSYRSTASGCYDWRNDKWIALDSNQWYQANTQTIAYYMDPRNFLNEKYVFMFESLSYDSENHTLAGVQNILKGSFMESAKITTTSGKSITYAEAFIEAAKYSKVSPFHLASRVIQEVGKSGSGSTSGKYSGYQGYYNFYNIGATQGTNPIANGLNFAKTGGSLSTANKTNCMIPWNSQYKAIVGGAYWLGMSYINSVHKQNTLYFQKFNTSNPDSAYFYHQYMGNIMAPASESVSIKNAYKDMGVLENSFTFIIPYYRNMPDEACQLPASNNLNPNNWLESLSVEGYSISFDASKTSYSITVPSTVSSVKVTASAVNSKAKISGTGTISLKEGANTVNVVVTAENSNKRTYTLNITKSAQQKIPLTGISLNKSSISLYTGGTDTLSVSYTPSNTTDSKTVTWTSSNTAVATVSNGKITAKGAGTATITAKVGNFTKTCQVTVISGYKLGDIDADGDVTIADALMIFKYKTGEKTLSELALKAADTDKNGLVELADALRIFKYKSGEISSL